MRHAHPEFVLVLTPECRDARAEVLGVHLDRAVILQVRSLGLPKEEWMPAERTTMRKVREIPRLKFLGSVPIREIARRVGVAASTAR